MRWIGVAPALVLGACVGMGADAPALLCSGPNAAMATVAFPEGPRRADVVIEAGDGPARAFVLAAQPTGSGFVYADDDITLRGQGDEAMLTVGAAEFACAAP